MVVNVVKDSGKVHVELIGDLDGRSSNEVTEEVIGLVTDQVKLVIDMKQCLYVSSAGLRTLLTIGKSVRTKSGEMHITHLNEEVKEVMEMTGFAGIFKDFE